MAAHDELLEVEPFHRPHALHDFEQPAPDPMTDGGRRHVEHRRHHRGRMQPSHARMVRRMLVGKQGP